MLTTKQKYQHVYMQNYMRREKKCEYCNREYKLFSYYRHLKTPKHLSNKKIKELENIITDSKTQTTLTKETPIPSSSSS